MKVLTSHEWVVEMFDGFTRGNSRIEICRDADGNPYLGKSILDDPVWDLTIPVTSPEGEIRQLKDWFWEIDFNPIESEI